MTLTPEERADLDRLTRTGKAAAAELTHARIPLLADQADGGPGRSDGRIVEALGASKNTVRRVRERFVGHGLTAALVRKPSARVYARKPDGRGEAHLVAPACSDPPGGRADWTTQLPADRMVVLGRAEDALSYETVRRALKTTRRSRG